jgi:stage II sporulation protein D
MKTMAIGFVVLATALAGCETAEHVERRVAETIATRDPGPAPIRLTSEPSVRVRILKSVNKVAVDGPTRLVLRPEGGGKSVVVQSPIAMTSGQSGVRVWETKGKTSVDWPFGTSVEIHAHDTITGGGVAAAGSSMPSEMLRVERIGYPGYVVIRPNWQEYADKMDVVAVMGVESYLPGVLSHELMTDWPRQAFEAQAVAARTYALHERERASREGKAFDVEDTTDDQVFGGASASALANDAVRATRGMVITERGGLLRAYYSSTCGGRPSSAGEVWSTGLGYEFNRAEPLKGSARNFACQGSPQFTWEATREDEELSSRIRAWGRANKHEVAAMTRLREIKCVARARSQRPTKFLIHDSQGRDFTLTSEELRMACNTPVASLPPIGEFNRVQSGDMEFEVWADRVKIRGKGLGHGVGMCQWCARGFAQQGMDWRQMMKLFYPGAEVVKAY